MSGLILSLSGYSFIGLFTLRICVMVGIVVGDFVKRQIRFHARVATLNGYLMILMLLDGVRAAMGLRSR